MEKMTRQEMIDLIFDTAKNDSCFAENELNFSDIAFDRILNILKKTKKAELKELLETAKESKYFDFWGQKNG